MSATLGDTDKIAQSLEETSGRGVSIISSVERPVPLQYGYVLDDVHSVISTQIPARSWSGLCGAFCSRSCCETAQQLANLGVSTREQRDKIKEALRDTRFTTVLVETLKRLLLTGVGVHHAGMLPRYRRLVENLAQDGFTSCYLRY